MVAKAATSLVKALASYYANSNHILHWHALAGKKKSQFHLRMSLMKC